MEIALKLEIKLLIAGANGKLVVGFVGMSAFIGASAMET